MIKAQKIISFSEDNSIIGVSFKKFPLFRFIDLFAGIDGMRMGFERWTAEVY
jgi:hypothetical protein